MVLRHPAVAVSNLHFDLAQHRLVSLTWHAGTQSTGGAWGGSRGLFLSADGASDIKTSRDTLLS